MNNSRDFYELDRPMDDFSLFKNCRYDGQLIDVYVREGTIFKIIPSIDGETLQNSSYFPEIVCSKTDGPDNIRTIDLGGREIFPMMIDVHTHIREPGQEYKEGLETGLKAALLNGISRIAMMSNTAPVIHHPDTINYLYAKARKLGLCDVNVNAAATLSHKGCELAPLEEYGSLVRAISDDGCTIEDGMILRRVFQKAKELDLVVMSHCERPGVRGHMEPSHEMECMGYPCLSEEDEAAIIERNVRIAGEIGCRLHICHVSSIRGIELIEKAKKLGQKLTCEVTPHHIFLSIKDVDYINGWFKVNPPLRTEATRKYLLKSLLEGKIDMMATDHAPHAEEEKIVSIPEAAFGFSGFDSFFLNIYSNLLVPGLISMDDFNRLTSLNPSKLLSVPPELISEGSNASFMVVEKGDFVLDKEDILSKGKNNPFIGRRFAGRIRMVIKNGRPYRRYYSHEN